MQKLIQAVEPCAELQAREELLGALKSAPNDVGMFSTLLVPPPHHGHLLHSPCALLHPIGRPDPKSVHYLDCSHQLRGDLRTPNPVPISKLNQKPPVRSNQCTLLSAHINHASYWILNLTTSALGCSSTDASLTKRCPGFDSPGQHFMKLTNPSLTLTRYLPTALELSIALPLITTLNPDTEP